MWDTIIKYAKQPSTWRGIFSVLVSIGILHISPEVSDAIVAVILQFIAFGEGAKGVINIMRDEGKQKIKNVNIQTISEPQSSADTVNQLQSGKF